MKTRFQRIAGQLRRPRYGVPAAIVLALALFAGNAAFGGDEAKYQTKALAKTSVVQEVSATGSVKSADAVDLAFERGGKVARLGVKVGDRVRAGQTLANVSNGDASAQLQSQLATYDRERIRLEQLKRGVRPEEAAVSSASVDSARSALDSAKVNLVDRTNDAFVKADDAVRNHADKLFSNPDSSPSFGTEVRTNGTTYYIKASTGESATALNQARRDIEGLLDSWDRPSQGASADAALAEAKAAERSLGRIQEFLSAIALEVNALSFSETDETAVYEGFKTDISGARTGVNSALASLRSAIQSFESARSALEVAERQNNLKLAPPTREEVGIQEANVRQAAAGVESARSEFGKTVIVAPVDGIVTKVSAEVGEIVSQNAPVVSVIADARLEVEVNVPEADLSRVRPGAPADITFDAYGKDFVAKAVVVSVDPAATVVEGVPTYRTIIHFSEDDDRIKSGLTANVVIRGERKDDVLAVPQRAIVTRDGMRYVRVLVGAAAEERPVQTGLRGTDGTVEITAGLSEGDIVILSDESDKN